MKPGFQPTDSLSHLNITFQAVFEEAIDILQERVNHMEKGNPYEGLPDGTFDFIPITVGNAMAGQPLQWKDACFHEMELLWNMGATNGTITSMSLLIKLTFIILCCCPPDPLKANQT